MDSQPLCVEDVGVAVEFLCFSFENDAECFRVVVSIDLEGDSAVDGFAVGTGDI